MKEFVEKLIKKIGDISELIRPVGWSRKIEVVETKGVIEIINELAEEYIPCTKSCTDCEAYDLVKHNCPKFCKVIKETVEEVKENYNNGWIPVSERLPESSGYYIISVDNYGFFNKVTTTPKKEVWIRWFHKGQNGDEFQNIWEQQVPYQNFDVVAWMELPQPYKEGSREYEIN